MTVPYPAAMVETVTLVTGASGFVGSAVARALQARGKRLRLIVRETSPRGNLNGLDAEIVTGDLRDPGAVMRAMRGVDALYHVAADYRIWAPDPQDIIRNNLATTQTVMQAALDAGVSRIVYTSSVATLKPRPGGIADEHAAAAPGEAIGVYKQSKTEAERMVENMVRISGLPAVIVNPSTPIGPHDIKPTPTGRIIVEAASGRMPAYIESGLNLVHVDDVAIGHILAFERGRVGERYILGGDDVSLGRMLADIAQLSGRRPPFFAIPRTPLFPLAWMNEWRARIFGGEPFLTIDALKMARHNMYYSSAKAKAELSYAPRGYAEALADALVWFRAAGYCR